MDVISEILLAVKKGQISECLLHKSFLIKKMIVWGINKRIR